MLDGARLISALAKGEGNQDKKFFCNHRRSYRSEVPLEIIGEIIGWINQNPEDLVLFGNKIGNYKVEIIY